MGEWSNGREFMRCRGKEPAAQPRRREPSFRAGPEKYALRESLTAGSKLDAYADRNRRLCQLVASTSTGFGAGGAGGVACTSGSPVGSGDTSAGAVSRYSST